MKNLGKKQKEREKKANQTRDQLDKHDFGKKLQKPRQMQKKTQKNKQDKSQKKTEKQQCKKKKRTKSKSDQ